MRTPLEVIMDVEAELALHGYADPSASLFRGCHLCFLPLHTPQPKPTDHPHAPTGITPSAAVSAGAESRLFQSTVDVAKAAAATQQALLECQARRVSLQVSPVQHALLDVVPVDCRYQAMLRTHSGVLVDLLACVAAVGAAAAFHTCPDPAV